MVQSTNWRGTDPRWFGARTFGDLERQQPYSLIEREAHRYCAFCKSLIEYGHRYSTRHWICLVCIEPRRDEVLPIVLRRERKMRIMARGG